MTKDNSILILKYIFRVIIVIIAAPFIIYFILPTVIFLSISIGIGIIVCWAFGWDF